MTATLPADSEDRVNYSLRGCARCGAETRAYTTIDGRDYCDGCKDHVADMREGLEAFHALVGTGEP